MVTIIFKDNTEGVNKEGNVVSEVTFKEAQKDTEVIIEKLQLTVIFQRKRLLEG